MEKTTLIRRKFVEEGKVRPLREMKFAIVALALATTMPGCATAGPASKAKEKAAVLSESTGRFL